MDLLEFDDPEIIAALRHFVHERKMQWVDLQQPGVSKGTLQNFRMGRASPTCATLKLVCDALGVERSEFFAEGERIVAEARKERERVLAERPRLLKQLEETVAKVEELTKEDLERGGISEEEHRRYILTSKILLAKMKDSG